MRCPDRRSPAGWGRGAWRGWRRGRAQRPPRRHSAPESSPSAAAPPGATAAPRRGRSGPRRRPGADAGAPAPQRACRPRPRGGRWVRLSDAPVPRTGRCRRRASLRASHRARASLRASHRARASLRASHRARAGSRAGSRRTTCRRAAATRPRPAAGAQPCHRAAWCGRPGARSAWTLHGLPRARCDHPITCDHGGRPSGRRITMSKRARKRRDRNKKSANHGKKPNT